MFCPCSNFLASALCFSTNRFQKKRLKSERGTAKYKNIWLLGNGLCFENKLQKETFYCFPLLGISKAAARRLAVSPQYWARAAASKVVEQQASSKISNFPFWFSQNQKTNSILRKGFEIENSIAVMSPLNGHNKGPHKLSSDFNLFDSYLERALRAKNFTCLQFSNIALRWNELFLNDKDNSGDAHSAKKTYNDRRDFWRTLGLKREVALTDF